MTLELKKKNYINLRLAALDHMTQYAHARAKGMAGVNNHAPWRPNDEEPQTKGTNSMSLRVNSLANKRGKMMVAVWDTKKGRFGILLIWCRFRSIYCSFYVMGILDSVNDSYQRITKHSPFELSRMA